MNNKLIFICACAMSGALLLSSCAGGRNAPDILDSGLPSGATLESMPEAPVERSISAALLMPMKPVLLSVDSGSIADVNLAIPEKFNITRPADKLTTTYEKYFITGTSDPKAPVYFGQTEISRLGKKGTFGVLVGLNIGENKFTFSQNGESKTVSITRKQYVDSYSIPITKINQSSMLPSIFSGAKVGGGLELGCIAPAGATVTATFGGKKINLKQTDENRKGGLPSNFRAVMTVEDNGYDSDITQNAGKVAYEMSYNGQTTKYESTGDVYIAGENSSVAVRVKNYMAFVYPKSDLNVLPADAEKLKQGASDYVKSQGNSYVELYSGGFVAKDRVEIIDGKVSVGNKFTKVKTSVKAKSEAYTFSGVSKPAYKTNLSGGKFTITFFNTSGTPAADVSGSKLFSDATVTKGQSYVTYTFTLKKGSIWGYNINYSGKSTLLTFNYKPALKSGSRPFDGITIAVDPGHGGTDRGAFGLSGATGPAESDVNLAHAYAVRDLLDSMGAKVIMTRNADVNYDLDARLAFPEAAKIDLFVSLHHNSIGENTDANKVDGVEVYYHTDMSKNLADGLFASVTAQVDRKPRFVSQSYYRMTLSPYSPSVLLELAYMSNPFEYERATNRTQINKTAEAIVEGIKKAFS